MIYVDCEQGSDAWKAHRQGIPTASETSKYITPKTGQLSASADKYIAEKIAELVEPDDSFQGTYWTDRGHELEPEARAWYEFHTGNEVWEIGMILLEDGSAGVSPDGLIKKDGMLEIKAPKPSTHVYWWLKGVLPDEHKLQCHAALHIAQRKWLDFVSYCPGFAPLLVRVEPDKYTAKVAKAMQEFTQRLNAAKSRIFEEAA